MTKRTGGTAALVCAGLLAAGCSSSIGGEPSATHTADSRTASSAPATSASGSASSSLANVDPCTLLTPQATQQLGVIKNGHQPTIKDQSLAGICEWNTDKAQIAVAFDFKRTYADPSIPGVDRLQRTQIAGRPAVLGDNLGDGHGCLARVEVGTGQVVDGDVEPNRSGLIDSCALLRQVMDLVMAQIPA
ncbi:DUF3558 domain-containing protein [Gandjariella thermophila]|uniref:DUF3558 domain-containing protein n=1 Tax=Gandjariella thermophila TaxID=1931992 RepID=A0A4D4JB86_9PSEU|nr:DUF3558 domain-containing protein [Gandjariella thermophila]GDY32824.1 hypothetical protein GTS_44570 [Gandjariella thermophila]